MKELITKLSSYNLFNYFLPGIVFAHISAWFTSYSLLQNNLLLAAFLYYFIGLVISRFGSLAIEPLLKAINFLRFSRYEDFVTVSKKDSKLDIMSESNNTYRTILAMIVLLLLLRLYQFLETCLPWLPGVRLYVLLALLVILFLFSYRKQTSYIRKRVEAQSEGRTR